MEGDDLLEGPSPTILTCQREATAYNLSCRQLYHLEEYFHSTLTGPSTVPRPHTTPLRYVS